MPMSKAFEKRLSPILSDVAEHFGTPFHIYDEIGIRETCRTLNQAFSGIFFQEFFAVKALPNPHILRILREEGLGFDCSSPVELELVRRLGATGAEVFFTSNNTQRHEFECALQDEGTIINLDDIAHLDLLSHMPTLLSFRYNPGPQLSGNTIIGHPEESKFGVTRSQLREGYRRAMQMGIQRFGLHTMVVSNERDYQRILATAQHLVEIANWLENETGIRFEFINIGGGLGIPYHPDELPLRLDLLGQGIAELIHPFQARSTQPVQVFCESGRYITGPHGVLVTRIINDKTTYRRYLGVDASMPSLMRPGMYKAYHHISIHGKESRLAEITVDVVGALCENNDKFAINRLLPQVSVGDILLIHDTGAHGHAMGFSYNGRLRPAELLLRADGGVELIRRAETRADHFATLNFEPAIWPGQ